MSGLFGYLRYKKGDQQGVCLLERPGTCAPCSCHRVVLLPSGENAIGMPGFKDCVRRQQRQKQEETEKQRKHPS